MLKNKFIIGGLVVFIALGYLVFTGFQGAATYYYTVTELGQQDSTIYGENVRVNGWVAPDSVIREAQGTRLKFTLIDSNGGEGLPVDFQGIAPDTFKVGAEVVVEGYLAPEGIFQASTILGKCPSRYEAEDMG